MSFFETSDIFTDFFNPKSEEDYEYLFDKKDDSQNLYKTLIALEADDSGETSDLYVKFQGQSNHPDDSVKHNNRQALQDAVDHAAEIGAAGVICPLANPGEFFYITGRVYFSGDGGAVDLIGNGPNNTVFVMQDADSGFDFSYFDDTAQGGGLTGHFKITTSLATRPLVIGKRVSSVFMNINVISTCITDDAVCMLIDSTQNSQFHTMWLVGASTTLRFDRGAANNQFHKGEVAGGDTCVVDFRATDESPEGQFPYTLYNSLVDTIIEGTTANTQHMVHSQAGALNVLRHCPISVNGEVFGSQQPTDMVEAILVECTESNQSSLIIEDCMFYGSDDCDIMAHSKIDGEFGAARVQWRGGTVGNVPLGFKGNIAIETEPWFFSSVTDRYDFVGILTVIPRAEVSRPVLSQYQSTADTVQLALVEGDSGYRWSLAANGVWSYSWDGVGPADAFFGPLGVGIVGTSSGTMFRTGLNVTGSRPSGATQGCQFYDTTLHKPIWFDGAGNWRDAAGTIV